MTLQEAQSFIENLNLETANPSEIKVYKKFLHTLTELQNREFTKDEIQTLEAELDRLNLTSNPENRKKHFSKALQQFEKFLKATFSLTFKGYYTKMGIALGISFGILFGIVFLSGFERSLGISMGLCLGMLIGLLMGRSLDMKAASAGTVI